MSSDPTIPPNAGDPPPAPLPPTPPPANVPDDRWHRRLIVSLRDCGVQRVRPNQVLQWFVVICVLAAITITTSVGRYLINEGFPVPPGGKQREAPWFVQLLWVLFNIFVLIRIRNKFLRKGWQVSARNAEEKLRYSDARPILYLRSFLLDDRVGRPSWPERFLGSIPMRTCEQSLTKVLDEYGPVIAIGRPDEKLPPLGAARFYVSHDRWQEKVADVAQAARYVVWATGCTEGLRWELTHLIGSVPPEKIIIWAHPHLLRLAETEREAEWAKFRTLLGGVFPQPLPEVLGPARFIYFTSDWQPRLATPPMDGLPLLLRLIFRGQDLALGAVLCAKNGLVKEEAIIPGVKSPAAGAASFKDAIGLGDNGAAWEKVASVFIGSPASYLPWTETFRRAHPVLGVFSALGQALFGFVLMVAALILFGAQGNLVFRPVETMIAVAGCMTGVVFGFRWLIQGFSGFSQAGRKTRPEPTEASLRAALARAQLYGWARVVLAFVWLLTIWFFVMGIVFQHQYDRRSEDWGPVSLGAIALMGVAVAVRWLVEGAFAAAKRVPSQLLSWSATVGAVLVALALLPFAGGMYWSAQENIRWEAFSKNPRSIGYYSQLPGRFKRAEFYSRVGDMSTDDARVREALGEINQHHANDPQFKPARDALEARLELIKFDAMSPAEKAKSPQRYLEYVKKFDPSALEDDLDTKDAADHKSLRQQYRIETALQEMQPYVAQNPELAAVQRVIQDMSGQLVQLHSLQTDSLYPVISFTSDGSALAIASRDKNLIEVVDLAGEAFGKRRHRFNDLERSVISANGDRFAFFDSPTGKIVVKEVSTGKQLTASEAVQTPSFLLLSPDGKLVAASIVDLVSGSSGPRLIVWEVSTGKIKAATKNFYGPFTNAMFFDNDKSLAAIEQHSVYVWDLANPAKPRDYSHSPGRFALSPDGQWLAWSERFDNQRLWLRNLAQNEKPVNLPERAEYDPERSFSPDGKFLFANGALIEIWDCAANRAAFVRQMPVSPGPNTFRLHVDPRRSVLAACGYGAQTTLHLWDVSADKDLSQPTGLGEKRVISVAFSPNGRTLAVAQEGGLITLWRVPALP